MSEESKPTSALELSTRERRLAAFEEEFMRRPEQQGEAGLNLREYWRVIVFHKITVLVFTFISVAAAAIATSLQTPIYRSSATIQIDREAARVVEFEGVNPTEAAYSYDFYQTQYELLKSKSLARRVIERLGLESSKQFVGSDKPSFFNDVKRLFKDEPVKDQSSMEVDPQDANLEGDNAKPGLEGLLLANLVVNPIKESRLVVLHYDSPDAQLAAKVVNTLARSFVDMTLERRFENSSYAKTFLSERISQVRANLEDSERKLVEYAGEREIVDLDHKQSILMQNLQAVNQRMTEVEARRIQAESTYQEMQSSGAQGFSAVTSSEVIQKYKQTLAEMEAEYEKNLSTFKPAYPSMQRLEGQIKDLKGKLAEETENIHQSIMTEYKAAVREQSLLEAKMADIKAQILELQRKSTDYQTLKRDVETNRELYDGLLQRIKEVGVAAGVGTNNISIIDAGEVPLSPYKPNMMRNLQIALIIGLLGGIGLAFLFEHLDDTIKSTEDLEKLTGLAVLGVVPEFAEEDAEKGTPIALITQYAPRSPMAEAYRSCRTALAFSSETGVPKIIHLTSAIAGEGKTTSSINLALAFAHTGSKVLLIDADLRNPSIHKEFVLDNEIGLTNVLTGSARPGEVTRKSDVSNLYLITTGPLPPNPAELLHSSRMEQVLHGAAERFDMIIIDGPPVLGLADALILSDLASVSILVVDAGATRRGALTGALARLRQAKASLVGAILTRYGQGRSGYGYNYHYDYYSYARSEQKPEPGRLTT